ncbi:MAG: Stp1/IreP family PP2C-type Ser/Thr phosphatase [Chloroflexi bacterium]|nr:Stp1/IreP family PP2C-type Ser/Thr phosphatase [Chloroflexota bacterium]
MERLSESSHGTAPEQRGVIITWGALTHVGMKRPSNQDTYCALVDADAPRGTNALLAVADGMGGHRAGDVASQMAIQGLVKGLSLRNEGDLALNADIRYESFLTGVIERVNEEIHRGASRFETRGMGTTLTAALLVRSIAFIAHVGDSRAYLLRERRIQQLTRDHTWVAEQVALGLLTPQQARVHPGRSVLTRALGSAPIVDVDTAAIQIKEGDTLLLCSDGLQSLVTDEEIRDIVTQQEPQDACQILVDRANARGGDDNITVVIARVDRGNRIQPSKTRRSAEQS